MIAAVKAGVVYLVLIFAAGFALGSLRILVMTAALGPLLAVALELPLMLVLSWIVCRWSVRYYVVPATYEARLTMGEVAFLLLIGAEVVLTVSLFEGTILKPLAAYGTAEGALGLIGQIAYAAFPLLQMRKRLFKSYA